MPNYFYTAKSVETGMTVNGELTAKDTHELSQSLKNDGLILINASELDTRKKKKCFTFCFLKKVPDKERIIMTKNLSVMIATGLPLVKSFEVLTNQARSANLKKALTAVQEKIKKGESLSLSMSSYPDIFSDFFISMIKVGEESGTLEEVLKILSLQIEKEHRLKSKVKGAMIYPAIVLTLLLFVGIVIAVFVLPTLKDFFTGMNTEIPFYTKILINTGEFSTKNWPFIIIGIILFIFAFMAFLKTKIGKRSKDTVLLKTPIISSLVKQNNCAILVRSLSSLLSAGVPLLKSLEVGSGTVGNSYFKEAVDSALEKIKKGESFSDAMRPYKSIFPFGAMEMINVGEETGKTSMVFKTLAEFYEEELINTTSELSAAMEPILIIFLGLIVAFFAFSIIEPMYSSLQAIA